MYWFRAENPVQFIPWLLVAASWFFGGWLIATHAFHLERRERLIAGTGFGLVVYLWIANLVGHWMNAGLAFILAGVLVLIAGLAFAWKGQRPLLNWRDLKEWPLLLAALVLLGLFTRLGQGTTLFDEWKNLSLISTMGAGDIPPHFYMNSSFYFMYHYGFQLLGASLIRLGGMLPWSAYDFSKALVGTLSIVTAYLVGRRTIQRPAGAAIFAAVFTFATGTRYLMLLLPPGILNRIDSQVSFRSGVPISEGLVATWVGEPAAPFPFSQAFLNGIFSWPRFMAIQAGPSTLAILILLLVWLAYSRSHRAATAVILMMAFSLWALSWEATYALFFLGGMVITGIHVLRNRSLRDLSPMEIGLALSLPVAALQGGTLTELLRQVLFGSATGALGRATNGVAGFSLRWPPAIPNSHMSSLHLSSPAELLVAVFEIGPILLLVPWVTLWAWRRYRAGDGLFGAFLISAWIGFLVPIFFMYKDDRDITRLMAYSLELWTLLLVILIFDERWKSRRLLIRAGVTALVLMVFGGLVTSGISLTYASQVLFGRTIEPLDTYIASEYWDRLEPQTEIFDPRQWRATALTGRLTKAAISTNRPLPEWQALRDNPDVEELLAAGYSYVYVDEGWWRGLPDESKDTLKQPCVETLSDHEFKLEFRRLLDIRACRQVEGAGK